MTNSDTIHPGRLLLDEMDLDKLVPRKAIATKLILDLVTVLDQILIGLSLDMLLHLWMHAEVVTFVTGDLNSKPDLDQVCGTRA